MAGDAEGGGEGGRADAGTCRLSIDADRVPDLILCMITEDGKDFVPEEGRRPGISVRGALWAVCWVVFCDLGVICVCTHTPTVDQQTNNP